MPVSAECLADPKASNAAITRLDCPEPERAKLEGGRPVQGGDGGRGLERIEMQRNESEVVHEGNLSPEPDGVQIRLPAEPPPDRCDWGGA
jgi:hypothetical protein